MFTFSNEQQVGWGLLWYLSVSIFCRKTEAFVPLLRNKKMDYSQNVE